MALQNCRPCHRHFSELDVLNPKTNVYRRIDGRGYIECYALLVSVCLLTGCDRGSGAKSFDLTQAEYVGQAACVNCHQEQAHLHFGSQHQQAMQAATDATVLADFSDATLDHHGVNSRMFRKGDKFVVRTEGPTGELVDFEVKYVFGVTPLQQYMVEFPSSTATMAEGEIPRVQVLRLCWDTLHKRWFYLPPPDVADKLAPDDDLHWTGVAQRWNNMCADCHSTDFHKNFVPPQPAAFPVPVATNDIPGDYHSTFVEMHVSCEACHGPGSVHVNLASQWFPGWNRQRGYGLANLKASAENEIQACAPCHSRRNLVHDGFRAGDNYYDFYSNQLLTEPIYYPDGQVLDEDYVHGSFIQSKMYHRGIRCSDCHDPHTAQLKRAGNEVCTSCHQHPQAKYDTVAHHHHLPDSAGAQCVNCHMPSTTYMEVDSRRDHSLRIPRPDLSQQLDTPNACTSCHLKLDNIAEEKRPELQLYQDWLAAARAGDEQVKAELRRADLWCDQACDEWYGPNRRRDEHFGLALAAGQRSDTTAREQLTSLLSRRGAEAPVIARATALQILSRIDPRQGAIEASRALDDEHPLVRSTAAQNLSGHPQTTLAVSQLEQALSDPVRIVRIEAARSLLEFPRDLMSSSAGAAWRAALDELVEGLQLHSDRSGAHIELGLIATRQGRRQQAITHYETGIAVEPQATGARSNLAALLQENLQAAQGSGGQPNSGAPSSSTSGSTTALQEEISRLRKAELPLLARDAGLLPDAAALQYRYGLALYLDGQREAALPILIRAAELEPSDAQFSEAAALLAEAMERWPEAHSWAAENVRRSGNSPESLLLQKRIEQSAAVAQARKNTSRP